MTQELWAEIEGFDNYAISSSGVVINTKRNAALKPSPDSNGYLRVSLYSRNKRYEMQLNRLIAMCFLEGYSHGKIVRHVNGRKSDCSVGNLAIGGGCREADIPSITGRIRQVRGLSRATRS